MDNWLQKQRSVRFTPKTSSLVSLADSWWAWWVSNQPSWHTCGEDGTLARTHSGDASGIQVGGQAGLLEFVMVLAWWGAAIQHSGGSEMADRWMEAVIDVTWILGI